MIHTNVISGIICRTTKTTRPWSFKVFTVSYNRLMKTKFWSSAHLQHTVKVKSRSYNETKRHQALDVAKLLECRHSPPLESWCRKATNISRERNQNGNIKRTHFN